MATGLQNHGIVPENFKKQLALAVRSIQWSYAIFWSISARQPGVLEWGDGYYNGDIKTRKTIQAAELNSDPLGLQRSEQLRELYKSLSAGDSSPQNRRPSAALSPEDLTDTEWYYLVCMSFVFNIGQGLPGRTLDSGRPMWLCNAHNAESKVFSRSLLAKSAFIQTVVCFPFLGGVIELGVSDLAFEDLSLIQQFKSSFFDTPYPLISNETNAPAGCKENDGEFACEVLDPSILDPPVTPLVRCEQLEMASPDKSADGVKPNQLGEDAFLMEGIHDGASQVQSLQFIDEEFSNFVHHSLNSSHCISQSFVEHGITFGVQTGEKYKDNDHCPMDVQECDQNKLTSLNLGIDDLPYQTVLAALLKTSHQLVLGPHFQNFNKESSFMIWRKDETVNSRKPREQNPQKVLKKILFEVPRMHDQGLLDSPQVSHLRDTVWRPEVDEVCANHVLSERMQREKLNERFLILKSLIPSVSKADKVTILDDAIEYMQELEKRVEELEAHREVIEHEKKTKRKPQETMEQRSDNYGTNRTISVTKPLIKKRKVCEIHEAEPEIEHIALQEAQADNVTVSMNNKDILIEIMCAWREGILLEIMDAVSSLQLDCHLVQSSTTEGIMSLTVKSRYKGPSIASARTIKCALQRVIWKF